MDPGPVKPTKIVPVTPLRHSLHSVRRQERHAGDPADRSSADRRAASFPRRCVARTMAWRDRKLLSTSSSVSLRAGGYLAGQLSRNGETAGGGKRSCTPASAAPRTPWTLPSENGHYLGNSVRPPRPPQLRSTKRRESTHHDNTQPTKQRPEFWVFAKQARDEENIQRQGGLDHRYSG